MTASAPERGQCLPCTVIGVRAPTTVRRRLFLQHNQSVQVYVCSRHEAMTYEELREAFLEAVRATLGEEEP